MDGPKNSGQFGKGNPGKPKGATNKLTRAVKEAFEAAFNELQGQPGVRLPDWAKENPTEFYKIASKLIPAELNANVTGNLAGLLGSIGRGQGEGNDTPVA